MARHLPPPELYVDGCDVCLDPVTAHNVRANLAVVAGRVWVLRPGDGVSLGAAPVLDGLGCLALYAPWEAAGATADFLDRLRPWMAAGCSPGEAIARAAEAAGGVPAIRDGGPADLWLVPGGPLCDPTALANPRFVVREGRLQPPQRAL